MSSNKSTAWGQATPNALKQERRLAEQSFYLCIPDSAREFFVERTVQAFALRYDLIALPLLLAFDCLFILKACSYNACTTRTLTTVTYWLKPEEHLSQITNLPTRKPCTFLINSLKEMVATSFRFCSFNLGNGITIGATLENEPSSVRLVDQSKNESHPVLESVPVDVM